MTPYSFEYDKLSEIFVIKMQTSDQEVVIGEAYSIEIARQFIAAPELIRICQILWDMFQWAQDNDMIGRNTMRLAPDIRKALEGLE